MSPMALLTEAQLLVEHEAGSRASIQPQQDGAIALLAAGGVRGQQGECVQLQGFL